MRWVKNAKVLLFVFIFLLLIQNRVVLGQYINLPYVPGGYTLSQVNNQCGGQCPPPAPGNEAQGPVGGYYEAPPSSGTFYPIGAVGGGGGGSGPGDGGTGSCTGVYSNCGNWTTCTLTCGSGTQQQACFDTGCGDVRTTTQSCNTQACGPWIKLKDSSFVSVNPLNDPISLAPAAYDGDDTTQNYFIIGSGGVVAAPSINIAISNFNPTVKTSNPEYKLTYTTNPYSMTPAAYLEYIKARKQPQTINSVGDIASSGTYVVNGDVTINSNSAPFNQAYNIVLVTTGTVTINPAPDNTFSPTGSVAILASTIKFDSTITQASGIFIASSLDTGTNANQGLKIIGNLIDQTALANNRQWATTDRPSVFIKFDQTPYINLLPYLGTARYEWTQVQ